MAAPKESLLSLGNLTGTEKSTFINARERYLKKRPVRLQNNFPAPRRQEHLRVMHLQQRWQELMERERKSQQHNRQLLQQFEEAQKTLTDMLACNAAMKTIRIEYEKYLEESFPRWQQQLKEKTLAAQKKRMEDYLGSYLEKIEEQVPKSSDRHLLSHGSTTRPQKTAAPQAYSGQGYSDCNQDGSSHLLNTQSSWLTHTQSQKTRLPPRVPYQPHSSSQIPPSTFPHPHPFPLHHLHPAPRHPYYHWPRQDQSGWASPQPDYPWSWTAGAAGIPSGSEALWGQLFMEDPPPESRPSQAVGEEDKTSRTPSSKGESGGGGSRSSHLSLELDIKPVRLSSRQAESSESGRDSSLASREKTKKREKREKRGRTERTPTSDRERHSSHESSTISSAVVVAAVAVAESSENDAPSEKDTSSRRRMRRSVGVACGSSRSEQVAKERTRSKGDDSVSQHSGERSGSLSEETKSEKVENQSLNEKPGSCGEESGSQREEESESDCVKTENKAAEEREKQESDSSEQSSPDEKDEGGRKKKVGAGDGGDKEKEDSDVEESDDDDDDDDDVSARKRTDEEVEVEEDDKMEDEGDDEEEPIGLNRKQGSASSHDEEADEDASEDSDKKIEEDDQGSNEEEDSKSEEEEEHRSDKAGEPEDRDSEDSIISPQEKRPKQIEIIPEEAAEEEDDDESKTGSSNDDSIEFSDEDIENLLAPPEQTEKKEVKDLKAEEEPKATFDIVEILQVKSDGSKTDLQNDSDEFDDFYD